MATMMPNAVTVIDDGDNEVVAITVQAIAAAVSPRLVTRVVLGCWM